MASPELERLLEVQEHDSTVDRLEHRRATLAERAEVAQLDERLVRLEEGLVDARARLETVARREAELEAELDALTKRADELDRKMYSGEVSAARDLQAMAEEVQSLKKRRSMLEDQALEVMEEREPLEAEVEGLERDQAAASSEREAAWAALAQAERAIGDELAQEQAARQAAAAGLPEPLAAQYERIRSRAGGVGAARLVGGSCSGCHLTVSATELDRLKKASSDAVITCEQCGRILVR